MKCKEIKVEGYVLATEVYVADSFLKRAKGLLGKSAISANNAMVIIPCNAIHTFFMRFNIDVIFISDENKIISLHKTVKPWKVLRQLSAKYVVELPDNTINNAGLKEGQLLEFK